MNALLQYFDRNPALSPTLSAATTSMPFLPSDLITAKAALSEESVTKILDKLQPRQERVIRLRISIVKVSP